MILIISVLAMLLKASEHGPGQNPQFINHGNAQSALFFRGDRRQEEEIYKGPKDDALWFTTLEVQMPVVDAPGACTPQGRVVPGASTGMAVLSSSHFIALVAHSTTRRQQRSLQLPEISQCRVIGRP